MNTNLADDCEKSKRKEGKGAGNNDIYKMSLNKTQPWVTPEFTQSVQLKSSY